MPAHIAPTSLATDAATLVGPLLLTGSVAALAVGLPQTGGTFAWRSPRLGRLIDGMRAYDVGRALFIAVVTIFIAWHELINALPLLATSMNNHRAVLDEMDRFCSRIAWLTTLLVVILAAIDVMLRRTLWLRRLSPSIEEAKRERRETEGAPEVRHARRREHERLSRDAD